MEIHPVPHASAGTLTLDISETQCLIGMTEFSHDYLAHFLAVKLGVGEFIVVDAGGDVSYVDLRKEEVILLPRLGNYPVEGRPLVGFPQWTPAEIDGHRATARRMAREVYGVTPTLPDDGGKWVYSDTSHTGFGTAVPMDALALGATEHVEGAKALLPILVNGQVSWEFAERVDDADLDDWITEKLARGSKCARVLRVPHADAPTYKVSSASTTTAANMTEYRPPIVRASFRECAATFSREVSLDTQIFAGTPSVPEFNASILRSNMEPEAYGAAWIMGSGQSQRSGIAKEFTVLVVAYYMIVCVDHLDPHQLRVTEHLVRRMCQIQRAVQRNPNKPDFAGLGGWMAHISDLNGIASTPGFDKFLSEINKCDAKYLSSLKSLATEEEDADKRKKKGS
jgi:hypothetical protein